MNAYVFGLVRISSMKKLLPGGNPVRVGDVPGATVPRTRFCVSGDCAEVRAGGEALQLVIPTGIMPLRKMS